MNIDNDTHLLLYLVGCGLGFRKLDTDIVAHIPEERWMCIYKLAKKQGVLAIVFDVIENTTVPLQISRKFKFRWIAAVHSCEENYSKQCSNAVELATAFKKEGIKTVVLKGLSMSTYYPKPTYREFGDFDCFLGDDYELGNCVAEKLGADVDRDYYRHSHIVFKSQMVENHRFCVGVRGSRTMKSFEKYLHKVMFNGTEYIDSDRTLIRPSCDFNALFLTSHAMTHFLVEGIKLRHICDWALLLHHEQDNIDWQSFYQWTDKLHYTRFANTLTCIAKTYLGLKLNGSNVREEGLYSELVMDDMFQSNSLFNKGYNIWHSRIASVTKKLLSLWKFHKIYQQSALKMIAIQIIGFLFERNPKL